MSPRRRNLLEAFQSAGKSPAEPSLFREEPVRSEPAPGGFSRARRLPEVPKPLLVAFGFVISFALGYAIAGRSPKEAKAVESAVPPAALAPRNEPRRFALPKAGETPAQTPKPVAKAPAEKRLEDSALFDPKNLWTVVVESYSNSNQDLAWATYEHLRSAGVAVFPPVASKNLVVVVVGAAPTSKELEKTEAAVRALLRNGKKEYEDAYRARIDKLIPRTIPETQKESQRP